jgi:hypothetical protein
MPARRSAEERFLEKVRRMPNGCLEWQGSRTTEGYGQFWYDGEVGYAHVFAYRRANGSPKPGNYVLHSCDNPPCVDDLHLFEGTQADNMRDSVAKGRMHSGDRSPRRLHPESYRRDQGCIVMKLSYEQVQEIRALCVAGQTQRRVSTLYGIDQSTVSRILSGERRREL